MSVRRPQIPEREGLEQLSRAAARHFAWAYDFTAAGDIDSAVEALLDAHAATAESAPVEAHGPAASG
jgi:hypothetical protein